MANIAGSFFQCFTSAGALARTAVFDSSGGKSQLVTLIASSIVLLVLLVLSPLLQPLPKACLGGIIIAALTGIFSSMSLKGYQIKCSYASSKPLFFQIVFVRFRLSVWVVRLSVRKKLFFSNFFDID